jgi:hypothetical protein
MRQLSSDVREHLAVHSSAKVLVTAVVAVNVCRQVVVR